MRVTLCSEDDPRVYLNTDAEFCSLAKIEQHMRTLQAAKTWLIKQRQVKAQRAKAIKPVEAEEKK